MAKIDLNALSIDELVALRDNAIDKLAGAGATGRAPVGARAVVAIQQACQEAHFGGPDQAPQKRRQKIEWQPSWRRRIQRRQRCSNLASGLSKRSRAGSGLPIGQRRS